MNEELSSTQKRVNVMKRKASVQHTRHERDYILDQSALGLKPSQIQSQWDGADPPGLDYIHGVVNDERRRSRLNLPEYEALHELCETMAGKRVMLCMVPDPDLDPAGVTSDLPIGALHLVMCCTIEMIDRVCDCLGLGIDTKWRTCEGGKGQFGFRFLLLFVPSKFLTLRVRVLGAQGAV